VCISGLWHRERHCGSAQFAKLRKSYDSRHVWFVYLEMRDLIHRDRCVVFKKSLRDDSDEVATQAVERPHGNLGASSQLLTLLYNCPVNKVATVLYCQYICCHYIRLLKQIRRLLEQSVCNSHYRGPRRSCVLSGLDYCTAIVVAVCMHA